MADRKFWQSLISLTGRGGPPDAAKHTFTPSCSVYIRLDATWIFPMNGAGGLSVMVGPCERVDNNASAAVLGEAVVAALSRSRFEEWNARTTSPGGNAAQSAGFKSYGDLERGAALLCVRATGEGVNVAARGASKKGGYEAGYEAIPGAEQTCLMDSPLIGRAIKDLSEFCVARRPKTRKTAAGVASPVPPSDSSPDDVPVPFGYKMCWVAV
jgi:hypothetical protein